MTWMYTGYSKKTLNVMCSVPHEDYHNIWKVWHRSISRDLRISHKTVKQWRKNVAISIIFHAYIVYLRRKANKGLIYTFFEHICLVSYIYATKWKYDSEYHFHKKNNIYVFYEFSLEYMQSYVIKTIKFSF